MSLRPGGPVPALELPDTTGDVHSLPLPGETPATVVYWTCNHCPYALAWHERIENVVGDYAQRGVRFLAVNSNDAERYPADSLTAMRERVERGDFTEPYLHDASQEVAQAWEPRTTPDVFVLDSNLRLAYRGAPDADYEDPAQNASWLRAALDTLLSGERPDPSETEPVGCSVKWKDH